MFFLLSLLLAQTCAPMTDKEYDLQVCRDICAQIQSVCRSTCDAYRGCLKIECARRCTTKAAYCAAACEAK